MERAESFRRVSKPACLAMLVTSSGSSSRKISLCCPAWINCIASRYSTRRARNHRYTAGGSKVPMMEKENSLVTGVENAVGVAGAGNVAQALGFLLARRGIRISAVASRDTAHARRAAAFIGGGALAVPYERLPEYAGDVLIAVSDRAVVAVAERLAEAG